MKKRKLRAFVDSDVVVSAVISDRGAAALLFSGRSGVELTVSDLSKRELVDVVGRLGLEQVKLDEILADLETIKLKEKEKYKIYVSDVRDAHVVAGADQGKCGFLLTYNTRHYDTEKIKRELNIIVMTPGTFLQYLRSLDG